MKTKKVLLVVEPSSKSLNRAFSALAKPSKKKLGIETICFPDFATLGKVITASRLELMHVIRTAKPKSIQELARTVGRDFKNVYRDVNILAEFGLIELKKAGPRRAAAPVALFSEIVLAA
jgi:predicted transcriptional regulator